MAPWIRSSHMNQNRCWPGVPNRYRMRPASRVTRPKSIATVVVVLSGVWLRSSRPSLAVVITASVVRGVISETEPTNVVLPTPKPPATTIFTDVIAFSAVVGAATLELPKSTEHPFEQVNVRATLRMVDLVYPDQSFNSHVGDQHPRDTQRHAQHRRDFRDRSPVAAEPENRLALGAEHRQIPCLIMRGCDHGFNLQLVARFGAPAGNRIRSHERASLVAGRAGVGVVQPWISRRRRVADARAAKAVTISRVQAPARIPVIATAAKHGGLLSLSAAFSPARLPGSALGRERAADPLY